MSVVNTHSTALNGSTQYWSITNANQTGLDGLGSFTFAAWARLDNPTGTNNGLMGKLFSTGNNREFIWQVGNDGGSVKYSMFLSTNGSAAMYDSTSDAMSISADTWYLFGVTRSGTSLKYFLDGSQVGSTVTLASASALYSGTAEFEVGRDGQTAQRELAGDMDQSRVWSRALTDQEMSDMFTDPCNFDNGASLEGNWLFNNDGTDETANGNDLTNNNSATFSTDLAYTCATGATTPTPTLLTMNVG